MEQYFNELVKDVRKEYAIAELAKQKGLDPVDKVEIPLAMSLAEKVVGLISTIYPQLENSGVAKRIIELENEYGQLDTAVSFKIAEEVAKEKFCKFKSLLEAIDAGIRVGFSYTTLGVVSSPIEGFTGIKLGKTKNGEEYFIASFSGPIRSAGTTASCVVLMLIDYLRELFGYAKYDPDENEIKRYVIENFDYHERVNNLQYLPTEEEIIFLAKNLPIQVSGEPTEKKEVSNYKDLPRVETNCIRGGMCLCFSEGLAQKAQKGLRLWKATQAKGFQMTGWEFLSEYLIMHKKREKGSTDASPTYIKDLVAGRPVFGHPSRSGAFRFRYGRSRVCGFSAVSIHPATMAISNNFLSTGTQLKIEKPTKGCVVTSCDSIDGPIVKLKNGSVKRLYDFEEAKKLYKETEEIIYFGDILFPLGDVINRNYELIKSAYVEEWWGLELKKKFEEKGEIFNLDVFKVSLNEAIVFSENYKIPLYPKYIYYWSQIKTEDFFWLMEWLQNAEWREKLILPYEKSSRDKFKQAKRALELLGVEHEVIFDNVIINDGKAFLINLGIDFFGENFKESVKKIIEENKDKTSVLEIINNISKFKIKDKAGVFIGTRMGRPEKAKLRKLIGSPNVLFPIGEQGGRFRSLNEAAEIGFIKGNFPINYCETCKKNTIYRTCESCGNKTNKLRICPECRKTFEGLVCPEHNLGKGFDNQRIDSKYYLSKASKFLEATTIPELIKGVRETFSEDHDFEHIEKGILRAKYNLCVNKDGTIRYDATELPITHFKPKEVAVGFEKLKEIGYIKDIFDKELISDEQILELKPHDIILPACPETKDERGDSVFLNIANFLDELLEKFYKLPKYYNLKTKQDLVGQLVVCMAPHNCAGVIGRIIGFSKTQGLLASPYMHAAMRRDCVYPTTNFVYSENGETKICEIGDYVEELIKNNAKTKIIDSYNTLKININKEIYAFGVNPISKKLTKKKIKYFIKGMPPEKWVKIKTCSGREQIMTPRHKFIYLDKNMNFKVKTASEIKKGDKIAVLKKFDIKNRQKEIFLPKVLSESVPFKFQKQIRICNSAGFFKKIVEKIGIVKLRSIISDLPKNLFDWYNIVPLSHIKLLEDHGFFCWKDLPKNACMRGAFNNHKWELKLKISPEMARVLGYYSAEGYCRKTKTVSQVCFRIMDSNQQKDLIRCIKSCFGIKPSCGENNTKISICNQIIYFLFKYSFNAGEGAYQKKVPNILFNLEPNIVKEYISTYFNGDGTIINGRKKAICFYSVSRKMLDSLALLISKFGIFGRFLKTKERLPGKKVLERYKELNIKPKKHILNHLVFSGADFYNLSQLIKKKVNKRNNLFEVEKSNLSRKILFENHFYKLDSIGDVFVDIIKEVESFKDNNHSYCFEVDWKSEEDKNVLWGEQIINARCDGDEAAVMMLLDVLINFSRKFLPSHRGGTQDAPLVLNSKISAGEVDDQILDFELCAQYPLELYEFSEQGKHSSTVSIETVKTRLKKNEDPFVKIGFTHNTDDFNLGVINSSYKTLPTMKDKVFNQMDLCKKLRAVDAADVARLIIDRHFIRDIRGNLRKFSQQEFRCVKCNEKFRRPPMSGCCSKCEGKIIFTISEGSIIKYLEPALDLANNFAIPAYTKQGLELAKIYIESIFGKEQDKQIELKKWF
ncbi:MAG: DNA polymerase II large subunit [Nanoarchaeota archaeon]|nr:DNA polymerase II large subunit [Nanoarchaeota archaeon]